MDVNFCITRGEIMALEHTAVRLKSKTREQIKKLVDEEKFASVSAFVAIAVEEKLERLGKEQNDKEDMYAILTSKEGEEFIERAVARALVKQVTLGLQK